MAKHINISKGKPAPLGATIQGGGINFALFSANASAVILCLYSTDGKTETGRVELTAKTGDIWHGFLKVSKSGSFMATGSMDPTRLPRGIDLTSISCSLTPMLKTCLENLFKMMLCADSKTVHQMQIYLSTPGIAQPSCLNASRVR